MSETPKNVLEESNGLTYQRGEDSAHETQSRGDVKNPVSRAKFDGVVCAPSYPNTF